MRPELRDVLRLGCYQLCHLDRVPPHAAVATAVDLAREVAGERSAGFVNAVLRRVTARQPTPPSDRPDTAASLATASSHPEWLVSRWLARFGGDATHRLLEWNNTHPPLVLQPVDGDIDALLEEFARSDVQAFPAPCRAGVVVAATRPDQVPGYDVGRWFVQDPAQALVVRYAAPRRGSVVFDACAAPGGKAIGLASRASLVVAADLSRRRMLRLIENRRRLSSRNIHLLIADAAHPAIRPLEAVLLDAPCLGTGTFARHPDARLRVTEAGLARLAREQARLLDAAADRVAVGGVLTYATCSLEPEENSAQVAAFLERHAEFRREPPEGDFPRSDTGDLEVLPHRDGMDGAFAARLVRGDQR